MLPQDMTTKAIIAELDALGDAECACSSAPEPCSDCMRYIRLESELNSRSV